MASIEARMGSSRFPGKVLADIAGKPALARVVDRLRLCLSLDDIVIATSTSVADDAIAEFARTYGVSVFRGSEDDVLQRVVDAQRASFSDIIVEITGDATLTDPRVVDLAVDTYLRGGGDVVSTSWRRSYPIGIDAQVFAFDLLADVAASVEDAPVREHVSLHFYEHPEVYRIVALSAPPDACAPNLRLTLDYPEDQAMMAALFTRLVPRFGPAFPTSEIVGLLGREPEILGRTQILAIKPTR